MALGAHGHLAVGVALSWEEGNKHKPGGLFSDPELPSAPAAN